MAERFRVMVKIVFLTGMADNDKENGLNFMCILLFMMSENSGLYLFVLTYQNFGYLYEAQNGIIFSSTGHRPASLCHGLLSVMCPSVRLCINFFFKHLL